MSRNTKIVIGVVVGLAFVCACGAVATLGALGWLGTAAARQVQTNPVQISAVTSTIADIQLPAGYHSEVAIDFGNYRFVAYSSSDGRGQIMFVQAPALANVDQAALERYLEQAASSRGYDRHTRSQVVGQIKATIREQPVTLVVQEGTNSHGDAYRSLMGVFQGKGGPTLLSIEDPTSRWNQAEVDAFIASIR